MRGMQLTKEDLHLTLAPGQFVQLEAEEETPAAITLVDDGLILGMCYYESTGKYVLPCNYG